MGFASIAFYIRLLIIICFFALKLIFIVAIFFFIKVITGIGR